MNLKEIAKGWYNFVVASAEHKQMIEERLAICDQCPHKQQISTTGQALIHAINKQGSIYYCGQCGCPLAGKTANPESSCPLSKWVNWVTPQSYY